MDKGEQRIKSEYDDLRFNPITNIGCMVSLPDSNNIFEWRCTILGPEDTSYKGGLFILNIYFPKDYPLNPPEVIFNTPIYHLNVNPRSDGDKSEKLGKVSISTLNWWKPKYTIREVLTNIFGLFYMQNPDSCYESERADEFKNNRELFEKKVAYYTEKYAFHNNPNHEWNFNYPA